MIRWRGAFDEDAAAHLLRRAAFAPGAGDVDAAVRDGLDATVTRLVTAPLPAAGEIERTLRTADDVTQIAAAIIARAATSAAPLRENLALFFHNHFVSAFSKVRDARMMLDQIAQFRALCLGTFTEIARAAAKSPAMVRYLDLDRSTKSQPNENFARELFELFTMGPGPYTEKDIQEAARALTGHSVRAERFHASAAAHDDGMKTVLGHAGRWNGDDVVALAAGHSATSQFMARKLARHFVADEPAAHIVAEIGKSFGRHGGNMADILRDVFTSAAFFAPENRLAITRSPAALAAAAARTLGGALPPLAVARHCVAMGQAIADPPSVKGYYGGGRWLNATTLLARRAFLIETFADAWKAKAIRADLVSAFEKSGATGFRMLLGRAPSDDEAAIAYGDAAGGVPGKNVYATIELLLLHPEFQRC